MKTEFVITEAHSLTKNINNDFLTPVICQHAMPAVSTRDLGVIFYDNSNFREQICRTCYYHILDLRRSCLYFPLSVAKTRLQMH